MDNARIWGDNLWNERFQFYQPGGVSAMSGLVLLLRKWDPTHPIWVGTYLSWWDAKGVYFNPGCPAYYDYPWERGLWLNFFCLGDLALSRVGSWAYVDVASKFPARLHIV